MKTVNAMQLKAIINSKAKELSVPPQIMLQNYLMECFLCRLEKSEYADRFIIKGGVLIASIVGLSNRTTMDIDTTVRRIQLNESEIAKIISYVCTVEADDDFKFSFDRVEQIRDTDEYQGFRAFIIADYDTLHNHLSIDITAGDSIYPKALIHNFSRILGDGNISLLSYSLETVLAEKLETILSRSITSTRPRDYYDVYVLSSGKMKINKKELKMALELTCKHRKTENILSQITEIVDAIKSSGNLSSQLDIFIKKNPYASEITYLQAVERIEDLLKIVI